MFRQVDAEKAVTEYETGQKAFHANRERLKAERLAREAAGSPPVGAEKPRPRRSLVKNPSPFGDIRLRGIRQLVEIGRRFDVMPGDYDTWRG